MSILKTLLVILLIVAAAIALCLLLGYANIYPFTAFYNIIAGAAKNVDPTSLAKPETLTVGVAGAAAAAAPLLSKLSSAKTQAQQTVSAAQTQIGTYQSQAQAAETKLAEVQTQVSTATQQLEQTKTQLANKENELQTALKQQQNLLAQNQQLQEMLNNRPVNIIEKTVIK